MNTTITIILASLMLLAACTSGQTTGENNDSTYTIGWVGPLTGDGAVYGLPVQRVTQLAVQHVNEMWAGSGKSLTYIYEDGRCNGRDALSAAQNLVQTKGVKIINGGTCSGETLGIAPYVEANQLLLFSAVSSSPEIKTAGDFVFRNYPSDTAQAATLSPYIAKTGAKTIAILSENTDYAQALRAAYKDILPSHGIKVVEDVVVSTTSRDIRTEAEKLKASNADAIILIPQTIPMGILFAEQLTRAGVPKPWIGADVYAFPDTFSENPQIYEGITVATMEFEKESDSAYLQMIEETNCEIGVYCAAVYDAVFLLAEKLEECGENPVCIRDSLYNTQNWEGPFAGNISFDEYGEISGNFVVKQVQDGALVQI